MLKSFKSHVKKNVIHASPSKLTGAASIYDCVANKMIKGEALEYLCEYNKLAEIDIRDQEQREEFCKLSLCIGLQLMFDHFGNMQPWLVNKFQQLGRHDRNKYSELEKKSIMDAFLFQAVESGFVLVFGKADMPDFGQHSLAARKVYKTMLGMGDRIAKTRMNNSITISHLLEKYWDYQLYQNENIQGNDKSVFRNLVNKHTKNMPAANSTDADGIRDLMASNIITDDVFAYVLERSEIYDYDIEDEFEVEEFCMSCISLGLHLFFDRHGKIKSWIKNILTKAGCKIGGEFTKEDRKAILDGFLFQAVETTIVKTYENADIPELHNIRKQARMFIKKTIGCADRRNGISENPEITVEILADRFRDILT